MPNRLIASVSASIALRIGDGERRAFHANDASATTGNRTRAEYLAASATAIAPASSARDRREGLSRSFVRAARATSAAATKQTSVVASDACATMFGERLTNAAPARAAAIPRACRSVQYVITTKGTPNSMIALTRARVIARG